ncbi:MAG: 3-phenylpropionate/trans-cinnamate dioxygenase ferredoxin reductase component, partial [Mycobacterium sp.]|nr:3-phenylpropionate/trans-cinnamate dioxygenase ferredoxin reductase component [Mycobacterium sp.]
MPTTTMIIVGGGLAGAKAVEVLRDKGFQGKIVLFGAEDHLPYERPPLSKDYLAGKKTLEDFTVDSEDWYRDHDVEMHLGTKVTEVDPARHSVGYGDGGQEHYDKLLLATGSSSRRPPIPGGDADGVHYLRTIDDASGLLASLTEGASLAVVGAGWIGLEVAASARERGVDVTVVETAELPLLGSLGREAAEIFADLHREHGVDLRLKTSVEAITTDNGRATGLKLGDGATVAADAVLVAVGAKPNSELAEEAGLETRDGGVLVDASLKSSADDVYAVGDIAAAAHPIYATRIRTEHWANALKQPAVAVAGMLGSPGEYDELPYFFTDQYDLGMEYVGYAPDYDSVVFRGDVDKREFTMFWLEAVRGVLAGMNVNVWEGLDEISELIRSRKPVDTERLAIPD